MNRNRLMDKKTTRREFLVASSALAAMSLLPRRLIGGLGANEKIRVAHVGVGGMGESHLRWFAAFPDCETVALADVDQVRAAQKKELLGACVRRSRSIHTAISGIFWTARTSMW